MSWWNTMWCLTLPLVLKFSGGNAEENRVGDNGLVQDLHQSTRQFGGRRENQGIKASLAWAEAASQCPWLLKQANDANGYKTVYTVYIAYIHKQKKCKSLHNIPPTIHSTSQKDPEINDLDGWLRLRSTFWTQCFCWQLLALRSPQSPVRHKGTQKSATKAKKGPQGWQHLFTTRMILMWFDVLFDAFWCSLWELGWDSRHHQSTEIRNR